jgi:ABC-type amino acid transport system permease subunit
VSFSLTDFILNFLSYFLTNIKIGTFSLIGGLLIGVPLAWLLNKNNKWLSRMINVVLFFCRGLPIYILMFALLTSLSTDTLLKAFNDETLRTAAIILALSVYALAAICDLTLVMLVQLAKGQIAEAFLIVPNIFRIFTTLLISSSVGAAIGVPEAVSYTIRVYERFPERIDRFLLVLAVTIFFAVFQSLCKKIVLMLSEMIQRRFQNRKVQP